MTIEWLAGNRLRGTTAERPVGSLTSPSVGGWVELARTTLGSAGDTISVASLPDKRYYMIISSKLVSGNATHQFILNNDTGSNYAIRYSGDGGAEYAGASLSNINFDPANATNSFHVGHIANLSSKEKIGIHHLVNENTAGSATSPRRSEFVSKWANTSSSMNRIDLKNTDSGNFDTGSEIVVLGWDPADTHTTNFWEELASVDLTGGAAATLSSGTITAKKYLCVQYYTDSIASSTRPDLIFNSDTGTNYANRYNYNGTESVAASENSHFAGVSANTNPFFANFFIINNSANEKLSIGHGMSRGGSGAGTAPVQRFELAQKWTNTSSQITNITLTNDASANFGAKTYLKVWGSD